jgi:hypothetical protein
MIYTIGSYTLMAKCTESQRAHPILQRSDHWAGTKHADRVERTANPNLKQRIEYNEAPIITAQIINQLVALGKPILPIHDSYIVKTGDRQLLRSAMSKACVNVVGTDIEAEARSDQDVQYLKYATTWRARDKDFYIDAVMQMQLPLEVEGYRKRYEDWKKRTM